MKRYFLILLTALLAVGMQAGKHVAIWPKGKMPDTQPQQIAAMTAEVNTKGFNPDKSRMPYLEWMEKPANPNGGCMILISGGAYNGTCDDNLIQLWTKRFTELEMHKTVLKNGVLIFLASDDKKFAIIGDEGIDKKVPADFWEETKNIMAGFFRDGKFADGLIAGIDRAGVQLKTYFPRSDDDINELPNEVVYF